MGFQTSLLLLKSIFLPRVLCLELGQDRWGCDCFQLFLCSWIKQESVCGVTGKRPSWLGLCKLMPVV